MKLSQLSLRELFLLVALVAMGCGWAVDRSGLKQQTARVLSLVRHVADERGAVITVQGKQLWLDLVNGGIAGVSD